MHPSIVIIVTNPTERQKIVLKAWNFKEDALTGKWRYRPRYGWDSNVKLAQRIGSMLYKLACMADNVVVCKP